MLGAVVCLSLSELLPTGAVTVLNGGAAIGACNAVTLSDPLPTGTSFATITATQGTCQAGKNKTITCSVGTMIPSASPTLTIVLKRTNFNVAIVNTATVSSAVLARRSTTVSLL